MLKTLTLALVLAAFGISAANAQQLAAVESKGKHGQVKLDKVVTGYLSDLNGRFRLRVTEVTYDPSGYIGPQYQFGSSIRLRHAQLACSCVSCAPSYPLHRLVGDSDCLNLE